MELAVILVIRGIKGQMDVLVRMAMMDGTVLKVPRADRVIQEGMGKPGAPEMPVKMGMLVILEILVKTEQTEMMVRMVLLVELELQVRMELTGQQVQMVQQETQVKMEHLVVMELPVTPEKKANQFIIS